MTPLQPLQATLAAEHAAAHLFGVLAAQTSQAEQPDRFATASARHAVHLGRRDSLVDQLRAREATPVAAAAAYEIPALDSPELVLTAGRLVEERCLAVYAALVAGSTGRLRVWAVEALVESSEAVLAWGAAPQSFPGADEL